MRLGAHVSTAGSLPLAFERADAERCDAFQIFTTSSRAWAAKHRDPGEINEFASEVSRRGARVLAHASYLINLASGDRILARQSRLALLAELERCEALGVTDLVFHPGAHCGDGVGRGLARVAAAMRWALARTPGFRVRLVVEVTAGQGTCLGHRFGEVRALLDAAALPEPRVGRPPPGPEAALFAAGGKAAGKAEPEAAFSGPRVGRPPPGPEAALFAAGGKAAGKAEPEAAFSEPRVGRPPPGPEAALFAAGGKAAGKAEPEAALPEPRVGRPPPGPEAALFAAGGKAAGKAEPEAAFSEPRVGRPPPGPEAALFAAGGKAAGKAEPEAAFSERTGVCFDTCHAWAAGYDLRSPRGYDAVWREFDEIIGLSHLRAFHLNDSKRELGARVDRHEEIGEGALGGATFRRLVRDPRFAGLPAVLELPPEMVTSGLARLRSYRLRRHTSRRDPVEAQDAHR